MKLLFYIPALLIVTMSSCSNFSKQNQNNSTLVRIKTTYGNIDIKLYNETPLHRDNFVKLIEDGFYNDLVFHRVIEDFMIQGGDPLSRDADPQTPIGSGGPGYTIPAEINEIHFHKKGALAAARLGDNVNPQKESSGSQFYIVQGTALTMEELQEIENRQNSQYRNQLYNELFAKLEEEYMDKGEPADYEKIMKRINEEMADLAESHAGFRFTEEQYDIYTTSGGTPHLDGSYTVFGETIEGFEVIDKIASVETNNSSRPLNDIKMEIEILKK